MRARVFVAALLVGPVAAAEAPARDRSAAAVDLVALRSALADLARRGAVGDRKVLLTFDTRHPGVQLSAALRRRYPGAITIVLQHQFERLAVSRSGLAVDLWFGRRRERVVVPFSALVAVQDMRVDHEADV